MTTTQNTKNKSANGTASKTGQKWEVGTLVHVAPHTLLMTKNIREAQPSVGLIKSVAEVGVLEPITAVITNDGADLLVRFGHRRTLAAIEAKAVTVPVYIVGIDGGTDGDVKADEIGRVISQRDENTHRDGLTTANEAGVVQTLTNLGMSAAQITKKARIPRAQVDAAITVNKSQLAVKAAERYDLTLDQLAVIAEFEDDTDTVKALVAAATTGQFDHVASQARESRSQQHLREALVKELTDAGLTLLLDKEDREGARDLDSLWVSAEDRTPLSKIEHEDCPGHVAWIGAKFVNVDKNGDPLVLPEVPDLDEPEAPYDERAQMDYESGDDEEAEEPRAAVDPEVLAAYDEAQAAYEKAAYDYDEAVAQAYAGSRRITVPAAVYGCKGWPEHGHHDPYGPPARTAGSGTGAKPVSDAEQEKAKEQAKKDRRLVIDNNKAWDAAIEVRREYLATLAKAKTPPKGTQKFLAAALVTDAGLISDYTARALAGDWLGFNAKTNPANVIDKGTDNRALVVALVRVLAAYEAPLGGQFGRSEWRRDGTTNATGRYLRFIESVGYTLSDVEKYAITKKTV
ncbi:ParB/RepB/Spo0J family partition protein [Pimelobacter sp. 30-1]|uniref:ParB/RepB/Spo0J family partition protein n=1 Tax=Pimelobacter sp. 30-1 TaxID=2004991 RepID=UPI001C04D339|nr:ParB N-terminal domain-containing protein [Pimelobacter sp. 30-1]MBU2698906.1 hypothetical protein [Pimelobacter sp. 30-1]